jgi:hypothetical protein
VVVTSSHVIVTGECINVSENAVMEGPERLDRDDSRDADHGTGRCAIECACCWHQSFKNCGSNFTRVGGRQYCASDSACLARFLGLGLSHRNFGGRTVSDLNGE